jgi:hypothetical protein
MWPIRKSLILIFLTVAIAVGLAAYHYWGERYQLVLTEEQLVSKLNEKFPIDKTYFFVIDLHLANPQLALENGSNRIAFGCDIETKIDIEVNSEKRVGALRGTLKLSGKIRYDDAEGAFFLEDPIVETMYIVGIPNKWSGKVNEAVTRAVSEFLNRAPIYRLHPTDMKKAAARLILRNVEVVDKKLVVTMGIG